MLMVGRRISDAPNDKEQLAPTLEAVIPRTTAYNLKRLFNLGMGIAKA